VSNQTSYNIDYSSFQPKHRRLIAYAEHPLCENIMAAGGIGSGKTTVLMAIMIRRALEAPGSQHAICHAFRNVCDRNLLHQSLQDTLRIIMPGYWENEIVKNKRINKVDSILTLPGGSIVYFLGLDDPDKLRGLNLSTAWINEANRGVDYEAFTTVKGRLRGTAYKLDGTLLDHKMMIDLNPTVKSSWEYETFVNGVIPGDGGPMPHRERWKWERINAKDNEVNLPPGTLERIFSGMTAAQRARDEHGEWGEDNPNALFDANTIGRRYAEPEDMAAIVVSLDPAGTSTNKSDSTGVMVAGKGHDGQYYVFEDATLKAKPDVWINHAETLRRKYDANWIISEKDYARDILVELIDRTIPGAPVKYVESRGRGKRLRAEPIAALYTQKLVNHVPAMIRTQDGRLVPDPKRANQFHDLERQMVEFDSPGFKGSPDRLDALVYALQHLSEIGTAPASVNFTPSQGFWRR
jgi:PBSX family phage terminase large subunit